MQKLQAKLLAIYLQGKTIVIGYISLDQKWLREEMLKNKNLALLEFKITH